MAWCGISGKPNKIAPSKNIEIQLHLIPLDLGLQVRAYTLYLRVF